MLAEGQAFHVHHGDTIPYMLAEMPESSVHCAITSPPFFSVFAYTSLPEDMGNTESPAEAKIHLNYMFRGLLRVLMPGRVLAMHCNQIPRMKRSGGDGIFDFRGFLIRIGERAGFIYDGEWACRRNPQAQAIRTKSRSLQFAGLEADRANSRGALPDYILKFRKPGSNPVPIDSEGQVSRNQWIDWAECTWTEIRESLTLNTAEAKGDSDTRHICAMQLDMIDRLVRLFSNPDEIVFDPFTGIGSTGFVALKHARRFLGCEIKDEYYAAAMKNLDRAIRIREERVTGSLFATA